MVKKRFEIPNIPAAISMQNTEKNGKILYGFPVQIIVFNRLWQYSADRSLRLFEFLQIPASRICGDCTVTRRSYNLSERFFANIARGENALE